MERGEVDRLMLLLPPRHGKSELASRRFPAFVLGRHPQKEFISVSANADLATDFGRDVRNLINGQEYKAIFKTALAEDSQAKNKWRTEAGGGYYAVGVGGQFMGRGADILLIDDPFASMLDAESETKREEVWKWYTGTAYNRLEANGAIILINHRMHEEDLSGRIMAQAAAGGDKFEIVKMPALDESGNALWHERFPPEAIERQRANSIPRYFSSLYQQDPRPAGVSYFDVQNILIDGQPLDEMPVCDAVFATMDTAVKTGKKNDGTGVIYCAIIRGNAYPLRIMDWDIVQVEGAMLEVWLPTVIDTLEAYAVSCRARMGSLGIFVEDKASGTILLQQGRNRGWNVHEIDSDLTAKGKDERAISVSGYIHRGLVKVMRRAYERLTNYKGRNGNHFLMQVFRFQIGVKDQADDLLDCFTYAVSISLGDRDGH